VGWRVLNSKYFGVPQSRQRIYIVGCYRDGRGPAEILFESERRTRNDEKNGSDGKEAVSPFKKVVGNSRKGPVTPALAYCLYACSARHTGTDWSRNYVSYPDGRVRRYLAVECERIQGFPDNWTLPSDPPDDADKLDSLRYQTLGNAVTVNVAEWLARRITRYLLKPGTANAAVHLNGTAHTNGAAGPLNGAAQSIASARSLRNLGWGRLEGSPGKR
jgi:DNA (cytosine-5)-methyltransferase 1